MKLLLVEDELAYQKLLKEYLGQHGFQVITAGNGQSGLALAKQHRPDVILLDVRLPDIDGMQVLTELRKDEYGKSAKVIMLTNLELSDSMLKNVIADKPAYYLVKSDIDLTELVSKINSLVSASIKS